MRYFFLLIFCVTMAEAQYTFPLKVSADGRYFTDQNNKPFFLNGDAAWDLPVGLTYADAKYYIDNADSNGFSVIVWRLLGPSGYGPHAPSNIYNVPPFTGTIFQSPLNEAYWAHIDSIVDYAATKNIVIFAFPDYLGYGGSGSSQGFYDQTAAASATQMADYGRALGARFATRKNILWSMGGDCDPTPLATKIDSLAAGLKEGADYLMTSRDEPETWASGHLGSKSWFGFDGFYTYSDVLFNWAKEAYSRGRPTFLQETAYENEHSSTPQTLRAQAWWAVLGVGISGQMFGNCPIWSFSFAVCQGTPWKTALGDPGRVSMKWLAKILTNRNW
jgi:hypothetical protein